MKTLIRVALVLGTLSAPVLADTPAPKEAPNAPAKTEKAPAPAKDAVSRLPGHSRPMPSATTMILIFGSAR